mmetsp:Transcript_14610/g.28768  ORF Transcript_14610/g.28768 Transcript_14610/m.28768 type:complete len:152 (-) Transcript_14610:45-500(-)
MSRSFLTVRSGWQLAGTLRIAQTATGLATEDRPQTSPPRGNAHKLSEPWVLRNTWQDFTALDLGRGKDCRHRPGIATVRARQNSKEWLLAMGSIQKEGVGRRTFGSCSTTTGEAKLKVTKVAYRMASLSLVIENADSQLSMDQFYVMSTGR